MRSERQHRSKARPGCRSTLPGTKWPSSHERQWKHVNHMRTNTVVYRFVLGIPSVSTKTTKYLSHFSSAGRKEKGDVNQESESEKAKPLSISWPAGGVNADNQSSLSISWPAGGVNTDNQSSLLISWPAGGVNADNQSSLSISWPGIGVNADQQSLSFNFVTRRRGQCR